MLKKNKVTTKYVTDKDLAKQTKDINTRFDKIDKRFEEQTKIILEAVDFSLSRHRKETDARFDEMGAQINIRFNNVDARFDELETELKSDINNVQTLIDGYVKAQEDFKQEFVIMKEEMRIMKLIFKEKLGVEVKAF